jgi:hypothetical protein
MAYSKRGSLEIYLAVLDTLGIQCQFRILNFGFIYRVILRHYKDTLAGPILLLKLWLLCEKGYPLRADETDSKTLMRGVAPCAGKLTTPRTRLKRGEPTSVVCSSKHSSLFHAWIIWSLIRQYFWFQAMIIGRPDQIKRTITVRVFHPPKSHIQFPSAGHTAIPSNRDSERSGHRPHNPLTHFSILPFS